MSVQEASANVLTSLQAIPTSELPDDLMLRRISVAEYHEMIRAGILKSGDPIELLEGWLVQKMAKNPAHRIATNKLAQQLNQLIVSDWHVQQQDPITLSDGEPEPDLAIIRGDTEDYIENHPGPSDVAIVIEVSDATINRDQGTKKRTYAQNGIVEYWIVNLIENRVEVYKDPSSTGQRANYQSKVDYKAQERLPVILEGRVIGEILVSDILPKLKKQD